MQGIGILVWFHFYYSYSQLLFLLLGVVSGHSGGSGDGKELVGIEGRHWAFHCFCFVAFADGPLWLKFS